MAKLSRIIEPKGQGRIIEPKGPSRTWSLKCKPNLRSSATHELTLPRLSEQIDIKIF